MGKNYTDEFGGYSKTWKKEKEVHWLILYLQAFVMLQLVLLMQAADCSHLAGVVVVVAAAGC